MSWCVTNRLLSEWKRVRSQPLLNQTLVHGFKYWKKSKKTFLLAAASDQRRHRLYCWGYAETGALGELKIRGKAKCTHMSRPTRKFFGLQHRIVDVACGYGYTLYATHRENRTDRQLYGSGLNTDSQIGFQAVRGPAHPLKMVYNVVPVRLPLQSRQSRVRQVAAGRAHSLVLTDEGVFSCGNNNFGQCGRRVIPNEEYSAYRELWKLNAFEESDPVVDMVCGHDHSLFLTEAGRVYSCGNGADGQTGLGHFNVCGNPTLVEGDIKGEKIVKLSSVSDTVLAINDKGDVFGWGNAEYFQLPLEEPIQQVNRPTYLSRVRDLVGSVADVAASGSCSMALTRDGEVFVWGYGILGKGVDFKHSAVPSPIPMTLFGYSQFLPQVKVSSLSCGASTLAAINNKGDLYTWGKNQWGQLGLGHRLDQFYPMKVTIGGTVAKVSCGVDHMIAVCKPFV